MIRGARTHAENKRQACRFTSNKTYRKTNMEMIRINRMDCPALLYSVSVISSMAKTLIQTQHPSERLITEACPYGLNITLDTEHKLIILGFNRSMPIWTQHHIGYRTQTDHPRIQQKHAHMDST